MSFHEVQWYDRNAISRVSVYEVISVPPHAGTTRAIYTVPKDRILIVDHIFVSLIRETVAAPAGYVHASVRISFAGANYTIARANILTNVIGDKDTAVSAPNLSLFEGQGWNLRTYDGSTGGTINYCLACKGVEFDAYLYHAPPKTRPEPLVDVQEPGERPDPVM